MAEDDDIKSNIKLESVEPMEPDADDEDYFVYNILEGAEDLIFDKDPLLFLRPIVYTTKLDDMKTIKKDLKNLNANQILKKIDSESRPIIRTENIRRSIHSQNLQSFIELADVVNHINLKAVQCISFEQHAEVPLIFDAHFAKQGSIERTLNSENIVMLNEITRARSDINFNNTDHISANAELPLMLGVQIVKQENTECINNSENMVLYNEISLGNVHFKEDTQIHSNTAIHNIERTINSENMVSFNESTSVTSDLSCKSDAASCADFNVNKECRACYVVLKDIKDLISANHVVKLDSHDRIISKVKNIFKVENDLEVPTSSKILVGHIQDSEKTSISESNKPGLINKPDSPPEERQKQSVDTEKQPAEKMETNDINSNKTCSGRPKRNRKRRIVFDETSSDEDYTSIIDMKKSKTNKPVVSHGSSNSISSNTSNNVSKTVQNNVSKTTQNSFTKTAQNTITKAVQNSFTKTAPNNVSNSKDNASNVIVVANDLGLTSFHQEKFALIVLTSKKKIVSIYRVNPTKIVTDCYVINNYGEYKLASMYPKEEKIIEQYCCWYKREEVIVKICTRKNYPFTILKFLKQPHTCNPEECQCCCQVFNTDTSQGKQNEKRAAMNKCMTAADDWIRGLLDESEASPEGLVGKALTYTPKTNKEKLEENKSEKYLENYLLCLRHSSRPDYEHELYEIGQNGNVVRSLLLHKQEEIMRIRSKYQLMSMPIRDAELCCWYKREKLIYELKKLQTSPTALKHIQKAHSCNYKKCCCCCKPLPVSLSCVQTLPSAFKHTTAYESYSRPLSIKFSAKSKNAMAKPNENYAKSKKKLKNTPASTAAIVLSGCASKDDNPNLSIDILNKFKNLKLGIDRYGKLEVVLSGPAKNLTVAELKVLSDILALSSKQIIELDLSAEEFCNRINLKSGDLIHVTTPETPLIRTEEVIPLLLQDHFENDEIIDDVDESTNVEDDLISISSNQDTQSSETDKISTYNLPSQTGHFEPQRKLISKIPSLKQNTEKTVSNMYASLASMMETKTKCYVDSFKSFFNKSESVHFILPNINKFTPVTKTVGAFEGRSTEEVPVTMPIIKETFTLAKSPTQTGVVIPGPSGVIRQCGMKMVGTLPHVGPENNNKVQDSNQTQTPNTTVKSYKRKIKNIIDFQADKKIRIKPPSELNAQIFEAQSISDHSQSERVPTWSGAAVIKQESQTNIEEIVRTVEHKAVTISPTVQSQAYVVTKTISIAPNMKIVSPTSVGVNKVIHFNGKSITLSAKSATDANGVRYLTVAPLQGTNTVETNKTTALAQMLKAPQAQPTVSSSETYHVPPLVPIRPVNIAPISVIKESDVTDDVENAITFNVIHASK